MGRQLISHGSRLHQPNHSIQMLPHETPASLIAEIEPYQFHVTASRILPSSIGLDWVLLDFTGFYWVLLGFTGFYWILLDFTGFYLVLLGFTGFYWVLLSFTGSRSHLLHQSIYLLPHETPASLIAEIEPHQFHVSGSRI